MYLKRQWKSELLTRISNLWYLNNIKPNQVIRKYVFFLLSVLFFIHIAKMYERKFQNKCWLNISIRIVRSLADIFNICIQNPSGVFNNSKHPPPPQVPSLKNRNYPHFPPSSILPVNVVLYGLSVTLLHSSMTFTMVAKFHQICFNFDLFHCFSVINIHLY